MSLLKDFFLFNKSDRIVLCALLGVGATVFLLVSLLGSDPHTGAVAWQRDTTAADNRHAGPYYRVEERHTELVPFDPNTADSTTLLRLGLQPWQVRNIYKYRAAGGIYREPQDFARLYGLTRGQYRRLRPYIRISDDYLPASDLYRRHDRTAIPATTADGEAAPKTPRYAYQPKIHEGDHVALNTADTVQLKTVPGIGSYFARQIVRYRERLGGFASTAQLREIDGFPESALPFFTADPAAIRKVNINKATLGQLKAHPYIDFYQARDITDYRRLHGPIHSLSDLRGLPTFPPDVIRQLEPYIDF